jgi:hypothetical protein
MALGGAADVNQLDTVGRGGDLLEVAFDRVRGRQLPIGAHPEPEVRLGGEQLLSSGRDAQRGQDRSNDYRFARREPRHLPGF